ncbi:hypothetical protein [Pseudomonas aeruginosa]|uniref:hypothetical protein n=1 Tax=Pseudomonas aeruginosa TaxID=287 RepID=UPI000CFE03FF|nr:hypothetical protein [Pseudomonas aeruginosa]
MSKPYRVRDKFVEEVKERRVKMIIETKDDVRESDLVNATLWKYLSKITTKDVLEFRESSAGRNSDAGREGRRLSARQKGNRTTASL